MGFETINDLSLRKNWQTLIELAHDRLGEKGMELTFTTFKYNGSYGKAKGPLPATYFVFAQDSERTWVELELKSRVSKGVRYAQDALYEYLRSEVRTSNSKHVSNITWNVQDIETSPRVVEGKDIRIKIYIDTDNKRVWVNEMCNLAELFFPLLNKYKNA